jgi:hypothetical protein
MGAWAKAGVLDTAFEAPMFLNVMPVKIEVGSIDRANVKVHGWRKGSSQKWGHKPSA